MNLASYRAFTQQLQKNLEAFEEVIGLVLLGSTAGQTRLPDEWSDHDIFVITQTGQQDRFRQRLDWLPYHERIVFSFRETQHGVKALYDDGHLVEFAVFDLEELGVARVNDFRVLTDRAGIEARLRTQQQSTDGREPDAHYLWGQFLTHLVVGLSRYYRGEKLSGHRFIKHHAVGDLLELLADRIPGEERALLDNLDPFRRFERADPERAARIWEATLLDVPASAGALLDLALDVLAEVPDGAATTVKAFLEANARLI